MRILVAVDGSTHSRNAARFLAHHVAAYATPPEVHLLHVHPPIPYPGAAAAAGPQALHAYQKDESESALREAEAELAKARIPYTSTWEVGEAVARIAAYVKSNRIDLVVMGSHGRGVVANMVMGSVASRCIAALPVPILVVPRTLGEVSAEPPSATARAVPQA